MVLDETIYSTNGRIHLICASNRFTSIIKVLTFGQSIYLFETYLFLILHSKDKAPS